MRTNEQLERLLEKFDWDELFLLKYGEIPLSKMPSDLTKAEIHRMQDLNPRADEILYKVTIHIPDGSS